MHKSKPNTKARYYRDVSTLPYFLIFTHIYRKRVHNQVIKATQNISLHN